jgi:hypothetical protein
MEGIPLLVILFILARLLARLAFKGAPRRGPVRKAGEPVPSPWLEELFGQRKPHRTLRVTRPRVTPSEPRVAEGKGVMGGEGSARQAVTVLEETLEAPAPPALGFLAGVSGDVARGLVMAEVLGPPMALRRQGPLRVR